MTAESTTEARLRDIEARCAAHKDTYPWSARYLETAALFDAAPGDLAWLVALVRRYRAALERIADEPCTRYVRGNDGISRVVVRHQAVAREALNEEG